ncbi:HdeD family acid-resistance protein [Pilimelia columellifera]|uniref:HdeD family acid-resistance protein n=1 Tax=Pilimelia columellifera subsp. columellifera TaxID=706583 RepID=A0ABN3MYS2_9ACTN
MSTFSTGPSPVSESGGATSGQSTQTPLDTAALSAAAQRAAAEASPSESMKAPWGLALAGALASIVLGVMVLVWPDATLLVGAALVSAWLLVHGVIKIVQGVSTTGDSAGARVLTGVVGVLFIGLGIACLRHLTLSLALVATVVGIAWLISGIVDIVSAATNRGGDATTGQRWLTAVVGAITFVGGIVVLAWPAISLMTFVWLTGAWLVAMGVIQIGMLIYLRSQMKRDTVAYA